MKYERWVKSGLIGSGIDSHYDITKITDTSHGPVIAQVLTSHVTEEARRTASHRADLICSIPELMIQADESHARAEASESRAAELAAQLKTTRQALSTTLVAMRECARHIAMIHIAELDMAENAEREALHVLGLDYAAAFERTAPIDWRGSEYEAETPLSHMLEESGEVDG